MKFLPKARRIFTTETFTTQYSDRTYPGKKLREYLVCIPMLIMTQLGDIGEESLNYSRALRKARDNNASYEKPTFELEILESWSERLIQGMQTVVTNSDDHDISLSLRLPRGMQPSRPANSSSSSSNGVTINCTYYINIDLSGYSQQEPQPYQDAYPPSQFDYPQEQYGPVEGVGHVEQREQPEQQYGVIYDRAEVPMEDNQLDQSAMGEYHETNEYSNFDSNNVNDSNFVAGITQPVKGFEQVEQVQQVQQPVLHWQSTQPARQPIRNVSTAPDPTAEPYWGSISPQPEPAAAPVASARRLPTQEVNQPHEQHHEELSKSDQIRKRRASNHSEDEERRVRQVLDGDSMVLDEEEHKPSADQLQQRALEMSEHAKSVAVKREQSNAATFAASSRANTAKTAGTSSIAKTVNTASTSKIADEIQQKQAKAAQQPPAASDQTLRPQTHHTDTNGNENGSVDGNVSPKANEKKANSKTNNNTNTVANNAATNNKDTASKTTEKGVAPKNAATDSANTTEEATTNMTNTTDTTSSTTNNTDKIASDMDLQTRYMPEARKRKALNKLLQKPSFIDYAPLFRKRLRPAQDYYLEHLLHKGRLFPVFDDHIYCGLCVPGWPAYLGFEDDCFVVYGRVNGVTQAVWMIPITVVKSIATSSYTSDRSEDTVLAFHLKLNSSVVEYINECDGKTPLRSSHDALALRIKSNRKFNFQAFDDFIDHVFDCAERNGVPVYNTSHRQFEAERSWKAKNQVKTFT
ncbi:hypothetical protein E3P77_02068 [Wallemia ichthyophaga]|nr:hypothetical protein E3P77_02068 [Wallemia ichthyophaga]